MSLFPIFNPANFSSPTIIDSAVISNLQSSYITSSAVSIASNGTNSNVATEPWVNTQINNAVNTLTGGTLTNTLQTLQSIDNAINNDPNFYTDITTSISNVQSQVNTNATNISTIQGKQTTDETNISTLQTQMTTANSNISTIQGKQTTDETNISTLQTQMTTANSNVSSLQTSVSSINNSLTGLSYNSSTGTTINNTLNTKSLIDDGNFNALANAIIGTNSANTLSVNSTASIPILTSTTQTQGNNSTKVATTSYVDTGLATKLNASNPTFTGTLTGSSITDNGSFSASGNVILGTTTANTITINGDISANSQVITPTQLGYVSGATSNLQTQLNSKLNASNPTFTGTLTGSSITDNGAFSCSGNATIGTNSTNTLSVNSTASIPILTSTTQTQNNNSTKVATTAYVDTGLATKQNNLTFDNVATSGHTSNVMSSDAIYNALASKQNNLTFDTTPTNLSTNPIQSGGVYTALATKQNTLVYDSVPTASSTNEVNSGVVYTALQNYQPTSAMSSYLTTSSATSTYQPISGMSSYLTTSSASSTYCPLSNANINVNEVSENVNSVSGITTSLSLDYTTCKGINYIQTPTSNFSLALTNIPTSSTNGCYTISLWIPAKFYCNSIAVNGTSRTMVAGGGLANISINSSATSVMQQISVMFLNSSTPVVYTNVLSNF